MFTNLFENIKWVDLLEVTYETFYMTIIALIGTFILGILLVLLLYFTTKNGLWENKPIHFVIATFVTVFRAIPFIILILLLFPFTDFLIGTIRGPSAALPALILGSASFYGRLVEIALTEVDKGVEEAAKAMG